MLEKRLQPALLCVSLTAFLAACGTSPPVSSVAAAKASPPKTVGRVVAPGRVEPLSEEIKVGAEITGRLAAVPVDEGDRVVKGQILARLDSSDYQARVSEALAELHVRQADEQKLINGARAQERQEALAATQEAQAVAANARAEMDRRNRLLTTGDISRSDAEQTQREFAVAQARYEQAKEHYSFVDAAARTDDRKRAAAAIELAQAQLREAQSRLSKTVIRSPVTGVVLRRLRRAGESVSEAPDAPILVVADTSVLRVRVDVDESDVGNVRAGQKAYVTADAYGTRQFWGHVVRVGQTLGHKNLRTDAPSERIDTKILETLVELDGHPDLPIGLRVDSYILTGANP